MKTVTLIDDFTYKGEVIKVMIYVYLDNAKEKGRKVVFDYKNITVKKKYQDYETYLQKVAEDECILIDKIGVEEYKKLNK